MDAMVAPDGRPATFDGSAWVSQDGKYWWNGAAWQPIRRKQGPNLFVIGVGLVIIVAVALVVTGVIRPGTTKPAPPTMGVSNSKIDSSSRIEFDYARPNDCKRLNFQIVFYDKAGHSLGTYESDFKSNVTGGESHHYVFYTTDAIPPSAVRFTAADVCSA